MKYAKVMNDNNGSSVTFVVKEGQRGEGDILKEFTSTETMSVVMSWLREQGYEPVFSEEEDLDNWGNDKIEYWQNVNETIEEFQARTQ